MDPTALNSSAEELVVRFAACIIQELHSPKLDPCLD